MELGNGGKEERGKEHEYEMRHAVVGEGEATSLSLSQGDFRICLSLGTQHPNISHVWEKEKQMI